MMVMHHGIMYGQPADRVLKTLQQAGYCSPSISAWLEGSKSHLHLNSPSLRDGPSYGSPTSLSPRMLGWGGSGGFTNQIVVVCMGSGVSLRR